MDYRRNKRRPLLNPIGIASTSMILRTTIAVVNILTNLTMINNTRLIIRTVCVVATARIDRETILGVLISMVISAWIMLSHTHTSVSQLHYNIIITSCLCVVAIIIRDTVTITAVNVTSIMFIISRAIAFKTPTVAIMFNIVTHFLISGMHRLAQLTNVIGVVGKIMVLITNLYPRYSVSCILLGAASILIMTITNDSITVITLMGAFMVKTVTGMVPHRRQQRLTMEVINTIVIIHAS